MPAFSYTAKAGLYRIPNTVTGDFYIGSSTRIGRRLTAHKSLLRRGKHPNAHLQASFAKHGESAFTFRPIAILAPDDVLSMEQRLLDCVVGRADCFNIATSAEAPARGMHHSAAARARIASAQRGTRKPRSAEHAERIARALRGRSLSDAHRASLSLARDGVPHSPEHVEKRAAAQRGKTRPAAARTWAARKAAGLVRVIPEESRERMRAAGKNRTYSAETREKLRQAAMRRWSKGN